MNDFGLYIIITEPVLPHTTIAEICVKNKIKYLQLREKNLSDKENLELARDIFSICKGSDTKFIVNDNVAIARLVDADGVHLGQDDLSKEDAEIIIKKNSIVGLSTHNLQQAEIALAQKPDYIGFGPLYSTPTKKIPDPVTGLLPIKKVLEMSDQAKIPVIGIGGIDETNINNVLASGIRNIAMVRYFMKSTDFANRLISMKNLISDYQERRKNDNNK
ncbi:MAG TPA: thiamine phosphate synthase [Candidatus Cloacimonadota bacterium]|jgi:thiamine-phosphate pyrophosphorylase|nr:thiamine phosphate synthase [Candidatus Cloacimonadales bacterium]HPY95812.1 thiamine phosphate synthase [Candidatus Cloacimonadota bacterium]HQB40515.1 thiamine phosphate synthase [Candidatus Cloacimonadota bacterium]